MFLFFFRINHQIEKTPPDLAACFCWIFASVPALCFPSLGARVSPASMGRQGSAKRQSLLRVPIWRGKATTSSKWNVRAPTCSTWISGNARTTNAPCVATRIWRTDSKSSLCQWWTGGRNSPAAPKCPVNSTGPVSLWSLPALPLWTTTGSPIWTLIWVKEAPRWCWPVPTLNWLSIPWKKPRVTSSASPAKACSASTTGKKTRIQIRFSPYTPLVVRIKARTRIPLFHTDLCFPPVWFTGNSYRVSSTPRLHKEFRKAVKDLPKTYSPEFKQRFYSLIDNFGTHYITKVNEKKSYV